MTVVYCPFTHRPDLFSTFPDSVPVIEKMAGSGPNPVIQSISDDQILAFHVHANGTQCVTGEFNHFCIDPIYTQLVSVLYINQVIRPLHRRYTPQPKQTMATTVPARLMAEWMLT